MTSIAPLPRKCVVPRTLSASASNSSWASSSRPVASGTCGVSGLVDVDARRTGAGVAHDLLCAARVVAVAPAQRRVLLDHRAQPEDAVHEGLRARGAARDVDV